MQPSKMIDVNHIWKFALILCLVTWVLVYGIAGWSRGAMMESGLEKSLSQRVSESALIFSGTVEQLEYGVSDGRSDSEGSLPYTYVTYRIEEALKGRSADGRSLTLRFLGGRTPDGRYLEISHMPQFQVGDRDLLFVRRNTQTDCPLVDCENGRFRVIKMRIHSDDGRPVVGIRNGRILYGKGADHLSRALTLEQVKDAIVEEIQNLDTAEDLQALEPVPSAEPGKPESLPLQQDESPPGVVTPLEKGIEPMSEKDRLESEALERNRGNPVLEDNTSR
jgi:hypothetical protein